MVSMDVKPEAPDSVGYDPKPCISLNDEQCKALGITEPPKPGQVYTVHARAVAKCVTAEAEMEEGESKEPEVYLTLCVTDMELRAQGNDMASRLYGG